MGRAWRIEFEGAFFHVMSRGNEGNDIFVEDIDRNVFYKALKKSVDKIRRTYLPPTAHDEMPQQKSLAREFNPSTFLAEASKKVNDPDPEGQALVTPVRR